MGARSDSKYVGPDAYAHLKCDAPGGMYVRVEKWRNNAQPNERKTRTEQGGTAGGPNEPAERSAVREPGGTGEAGDGPGSRGPVVWPEAGGRTAAWRAVRPEGGQAGQPGASEEPAGTPGSWFDKKRGPGAGAAALDEGSGPPGKASGVAPDSVPGTASGVTPDSASVGADLLAPFDTARPSARPAAPVPGRPPTPSSTRRLSPRPGAGVPGGRPGPSVTAAPAEPETRPLSKKDQVEASAPVTRVTSDMNMFGVSEPGTAVLPEPVPGASRTTGTPSTPGGAPAPAPRPPKGAGPRPAWERTGEPGRNHDPHEVTVQLDGVGRRLDGGRTPAPGTAPGAAGTGRPTGPVADGGGKDSDGPVFVDESGRRSRRFRRIGIAVGIACGLYAVVIVATLLSGNSAAPWVPVPIPGAADKAPANKVETSSRPSHSAAPSAVTGGVLPGVSADPGGPTGGAAPPVGASASPGVSAGSSKKPGTSGKKPKPSASTTKKSSGGGTKTDPGTGGGGTGTVDNPPASPSPTTSAVTSPDPSPSVGPGAAGGTTDNAADGPAAQTPVAADGPSAAPPAQSPETTL
ncbi:hypothetical protein QFZ64_002785 [Streptomyces sp. B3I8]|nr:hypothetical protein [Streptomyces sp. B3I8]